MRLDLNGTEERVLAETLEASLNRLKDEIAHTDDHDFRDALKVRRDIMQTLRDKLH